MASSPASEAERGGIPPDQAPIERVARLACEMIDTEHHEENAGEDDSGLHQGKPVAVVHQARDHLQGYSGRQGILLVTPHSSSKI